MARSSSASPKILLIRFSSIGDIVLTSPVIRCLKQQLGAEIHFLTKARFHNQLVANPMIDRLLTIQSSLREVLPSLKASNYDYIIDLHKNLRSLRVRMALRRPTFSFDKLNWQKWLLTNLHVDRLPEKHLVDRYFEGLKALGIQNDQQGLDYFIPHSENIQLSDLWAEAPDLSGGYIAVAIGAAHATKRLPVEQLLSLCQQVPLPIVLIGGPGDRNTGDRIVQVLDQAIYNACGQISVSASAALIRKSTLVISHDTGMMHIAAAFNKKVISIWGSTVPKFGMYPYFKEQQDLGKMVEVEGLSCRPCSKIGHERCPQGHFKCMRGIEAKAVGKLVLELLA